MTLEQQVTSLEISKRLKELGVKQESLFYYLWSYGKETFTLLDKNATNKIHDEDVSAFTVAELGEMLPKITRSGNTLFEKSETDRAWNCDTLFLPENYAKTVKHSEHADTEANARGKMLIYLLENKLI